MFQLLRSSLVNNRTQAVVCDDLGMTNYIINTNHHLSERNELKMKEKADLVEGLYIVWLEADISRSQTWVNSVCLCVCVCVCVCLCVYLFVHVS